MLNFSQTTIERDILSISQLNQTAKNLLESHFATLWVEGEISNFACPSSGHWYFSLKDKEAQVRCAMFRGYNSRLGFKPEDGMHVIARVKVSLYTGRGEFQLLVEHLEEVGNGALQRAFEQLKAKLAKEGLFDSAHKKILPGFPKKIGVVTSATGAAIRDILSVIGRRYPSLPVIIYPTLVQGEQAAEQIAQAIALANQRAECDVIIVARGGGSLEDLWPFNEEVVARAIFASALPIISGVGHEIDFTIADFVADQRAPTPSAAAELATPDIQDILQGLLKLQQRLAYHAAQHLKQQRLAVAWLAKRLQQQHPIKQLQDQSQRCDRLEQSLKAVMPRLLQNKLHQLNHLHANLLRLNPLPSLQRYQLRLSHFSQRLPRACHLLLQQRQQQLQSLTRNLETVSPQATLERGYAVVSKADGTILRAAASVQAGESLQIQLAKGKVISKAERIE